MIILLQSVSVPNPSLSFFSLQVFLSCLSSTYAPKTPKSPSIATLPPSMSPGCWSRLMAENSEENVTSRFTSRKKEPEVVVKRTTYPLWSLSTWRLPK